MPSTRPGGSSTTIEADGRRAAAFAGRLRVVSLVGDEAAVKRAGLIEGQADSCHRTLVHLHRIEHEELLTVLGFDIDETDDKAFAFGDRKSTRLNSSHQIISYAV